MPPPVPQQVQKATSLEPDAPLPPGAILAFTFTAPGVTVNVWATQEATGVRFDFRTSLDPGWNIDLNGFFLDIGGDGGSIRSYGSASNNMNGGGRDGYDKAVVLGSVGGNDADFRDGFWLLEGITLADLEGADAGLRATSYGYGNREDSLKLEDENPLIAAIDIDKVTAGEDLVFGDGVVLDPGESVTWKYTVTNTGNVPLENVSVVDDQGELPQYVSGDTNLDGILDVGEIWVYEAYGTAIDTYTYDTGEYKNTGTVTADPVGLVGVVTDSDVSSYTAFELS